MPTLAHLWRCSSLTVAWFRARSDGAELNRCLYHFLLDRLGEVAAKDTCDITRPGKGVRHSETLLIKTKREKLLYLHQLESWQRASHQ